MKWTQGHFQNKYLFKARTFFVKSIRRGVQIASNSTHLAARDWYFHTLFNWTNPVSPPDRTVINTAEAPFGPVPRPLDSYCIVIGFEVLCQHAELSVFAGLSVSYCYPNSTSMHIYTICHGMDGVSVYLRTCTFVYFQQPTLMRVIASRGTVCLHVLWNVHTVMASDGSSSQERPAGSISARKKLRKLNHLAEIIRNLFKTDNKFDLVLSSWRKFDIFWHRVDKSSSSLMVGNRHLSFWSE